MKKDIDIKEMLGLSKKLYARNKKKWGKATPESNIYWVSWLVGEIGEVIDIIKTYGSKKIMRDKSVRQDMLKELADCYMYLADILNRYKISPKEFSDIYRAKMQHNLNRNYEKE